MAASWFFVFFSIFSQNFSIHSIATQCSRSLTKTWVQDCRHAFKFWLVRLPAVRLIFSSCPPLLSWLKEFKKKLSAHQFACFTSSSTFLFCPSTFSSSRLFPILLLHLFCLFSLSVSRAGDSWYGVPGFVRYDLELNFLK